MELTSEKTIQLEEIARQLRADSLRLIHRRGAGHPGGALSAAEIIAVLYFHTLRIDPRQPDWEQRDRFILSKGHASAVLYAALARRGFFTWAKRRAVSSASFRRCWPKCELRPDRRSVSPRDSIHSERTSPRPLRTSMMTLGSV